MSTSQGEKHLSVAHLTECGEKHQQISCRDGAVSIQILAARTVVDRPHNFRRRSGPLNHSCWLWVRCTPHSFEFRSCHRPPALRCQIACPRVGASCMDGAIGIHSYAPTQCPRSVLHSIGIGVDLPKQHVLNETCHGEPRRERPNRWSTPQTRASYPSMGGQTQKTQSCCRPAFPREARRLRRS